MESEIRYKTNTFSCPKCSNIILIEDIVGRIKEIDIIEKEKSNTWPEDKIRFCCSCCGQFFVIERE